MSENWKFQISVKTGDTMVNVRAETPEEFDANLRFVDKNAAQLLAFAEALKPHTPMPTTFGTGAGSPTASQPPTSAPAPGFYSQNLNSPPPGAHRVQVVGVETKEGVSEATGKPWKKWSVKFSDGRQASTFDSLVASIALKAQADGFDVVAITKPSKNPKYTDLDALQRAGAPV